MRDAFGEPPDDNPGFNMFDEVTELGEDNLLIEGVIFEADYGLYDEIRNLGGRGVPFHGYHGEGRDYSPGVFAGYGRRFRHCVAVDCQPTVIMEDGTGKLNERMLEAGVEYYSILGQVEVLFYGEKISTSV